MLVANARWYTGMNPLDHGALKLAVPYLLDGIDWSLLSFFGIFFCMSNLEDV